MAMSERRDGAAAIIAAMRELYRAQRRTTARLEEQEKKMERVLEMLSEWGPRRRVLENEMWVLRSRVELAEQRLAAIDVVHFEVGRVGSAVHGLPTANEVTSAFEECA